MFFILYVKLLIDLLKEACSTVNICSIDLNRAFDKVNHSALLYKIN